MKLYKRAIEQSYGGEDRELDIYEADAGDLVMIVENDYQLYKQRMMPMYENLTRKKFRGIYDSALAAKLFMYVIDEAAKKWWKSTYDWADDGKSRVLKPTREVKQEAAEQMVKDFENAFDNREYDFMNEFEKKYKARGFNTENKPTEQGDRFTEISTESAMNDDVIIRQYGEDTEEERKKKLEERQKMKSTMGKYLRPTRLAAEPELGKKPPSYPKKLDIQQTVKGDPHYMERREKAPPASSDLIALNKDYHENKNKIDKINADIDDLIKSSGRTEIELKNQKIAQEIGAHLSAMSDRMADIGEKILYLQERVEETTVITDDVAKRIAEFKTKQKEELEAYLKNVYAQMEKIKDIIPYKTYELDKPKSMASKFYSIDRVRTAAEGGILKALWNAIKGFGGFLDNTLNELDEIEAML